MSLSSFHHATAANRGFLWRLNLQSFWWAFCRIRKKKKNGHAHFSY